MVADAQGQFGDEPFLEGAARSGFKVRAPRREELSPWIEEAPLQFLPGRQPLAWPAGRVQGPPRPLEGESWAVVTLPPAGWVRTLLPAWRVTPGAEDLPIFGYTPLFVREGELYWAALPLELNLHWDPKEYDKPSLEADIEATKRALPGNRLLEQLAICAREYGCCNAQNIFYGRWEGAVPISPQCNARCRGCISKQPAGGPPSPQIRLDFTPTVEEIAQLSLFHLRRAPDPILSFGQGCEGEPLLQAERAAQAVRLVRAQEGRGTLHMNSNGSLPQKAQLLFEAGLDSMRVSLCSALEESYVAYYQPQHYKFRDVLETIERGRAAGAGFSVLLHLGEALAAVDRAVLTRLERHLAGLAAAGAHGVEHLALTADGVLAGIAAGFAALGLVLETAGSVEFLLAGGPDELLAAILAYQSLVFKHSGYLLLKYLPAEEC